MGDGDGDAGESQRGDRWAENSKHTTASARCFKVAYVADAHAGQDSARACYAHVLPHTIGRHDFHTESVGLRFPHRFSGAAKTICMQSRHRRFPRKVSKGARAILTRSQQMRFQHRVGKGEFHAEHTCARDMRIRPTRATFTIVCFGLKRIKHQRQLSPS